MNCSSAQKNRPAFFLNFIILLSILFQPLTVYANEKIRVALLSPDPPEDYFWGSLVRFAEAVAEDLNIELTVHYSNATTYKIKKDGLAAIDSQPHYFITAHWPMITVEHLSRAKSQNTRVFIINTEIKASHDQEIGQPRGHYGNWIGHMAANDIEAGYQLARALSDAYEQTTATDSESQNMNFIGLSSYPEEYVANARNMGLQRFIRSKTNSKLNTIDYALWSESQAEKLTQQLLRNYPDTNIVWAASDSMALGAVKGIRAMDKTPGKDILTGGVDWTQQALQAIKDGTLTASVGGHFMEAGWALILINDFDNGIDFADELGLSIQTHMYTITARNIDDYLKFINAPDWSVIDFKRFSKQYNPDLKQYDFETENILKYFNK